MKAIYVIQRKCHNTARKHKEGVIMEVQVISIAEAKKYLDDKKASFVDIRDSGSFESGHIEGAIFLNDSNVEDYMKNADKIKIHIIYCYHGNSSKGATAYFNAQGFENTFSMTGGYTEWDNQFPQD
jgi:thiosulfate sulfurtransferase